MNMQNFSIADISQWDRFYRANMISSLSGYKPAMLIGTLHENGLPNVAMFQNFVHLGADPALIGMVSRPRAASPHTIENIERNKCFTLNSVHESFLSKAHQTAAKYNDSISEFEAAGLTAINRPNLMAPFVAESSIQVMVNLVEIIPISYNQTFFIIGAISQFFIAENLIQPDGFIDTAKAGLACSIGLDGYSIPTGIKRFAYPKPFEEPKPLIQ